VTMRNYSPTSTSAGRDSSTTSNRPEIRRADVRRDRLRQPDRPCGTCVRGAIANPASRIDNHRCVPIRPFVARPTTLRGWPVRVFFGAPFGSLVAASALVSRPGRRRSSGAFDASGDTAASLGARGPRLGRARLHGRVRSASTTSSW
jgi:hypothetical protein